MRLYNKKDENSIVIDSNSVEEIFQFLKLNLCKIIDGFNDFGPNYKPAIIQFINDTMNDKYNINTYIRKCIDVLNEVLSSKYNCKCLASKRLYLGYYIEIGIKNPQDALRKEQQRRSPRCVEYWLKKGYSKEESQIKVSEYQSKNGYHSAKRLNIDYWLQIGFSLEEAKEKQYEYKLKIASSSKEHMQKINHYSNDKIAIIQKEKYNSKDPKKYAKRHNVSLDEAKQCIARIIEKAKRYGPSNGMYGKPSPLKSGAAFSGHYKNFLFRSLPEYYFIKYNEYNGIKSAEKEFAIKLTNGKTYHPDFVIGKTLYEIKADYMMQNKETIQKTNELKEAFPDYEIKLIPASSIKPLDKETILNDIKNNDLQIASNKQERFNRYLERK